MLSANDIRLLAERIAQLSDNHRRISEALKGVAGLQNRTQDGRKPESPSGEQKLPPNVLQLSDVTKVKQV